MLIYLLLTYILLATGWCVYRIFVRSNISFQGRKIFLIATLLLSVFIPVLFAKTELKEEVKKQPIISCTYDVFAEFCPKDELLEACFSFAQTDQDFCSCEHVARENILVYHSSNWYDFLVWQEHSFIKLLRAGALLVFSVLLLQICYLLFLIYSSRREKLMVDGRTYTILYNARHQQAGSFRFFGNYITWREEMNHLSVSEKKAILYHEISHIQQLDTWTLLMVKALQPLWLIHPFYYFIRREINELSEFIADQMAILQSGESPKRYADLLLRMSSDPAPALVSAINGEDLKRRIQNILRPRRNAPNGGILGLSLCILVGLHIAVSYEVFPWLQWQTDKLKVYETLARENHQLGKTVFCKNCLKKKLENHTHE